MSIKNILGSKQNSKKMENNESFNIIHKILEKTFAYSLETVKLNPDGTISHLHSAEFLEKHPERKNSPEFTEEEELEQIKFINELAKRI